MHVLETLTVNVQVRKTLMLEKCLRNVCEIEGMEEQLKKGYDIESFVV